MLKKLANLILVLSCLFTLNLSAQVYEPVTIDESERYQNLKRKENRILLSGSHNVPIAGANQGFKQGYGVDFQYYRNFENLEYQVIFNFTSLKGKSNISYTNTFEDVLINFGRLNVISFKTGVGYKIDINEKLSAVPGGEIGYGVFWHNRDEVSVSTPSVIYENSAIGGQLNFGPKVRFNYQLSDVIGFFLEPNFSFLITFGGLYSGLDISEDDIFERKNDFFSVVYSTKGGLSFSF